MWPIWPYPYVWGYGTLLRCPAIADRHDFEFRRPCTIAKGGDTCEFRFYRKGTAPDTELIEGVPVHWNETLNR